MGDFSELFVDIDDDSDSHRRQRSQIVPFSFQVANYTKYGSALQAYFKDSANPKECPVTYKPLTINNSCILPCGHIFSKKCIKVMKVKHPITCPLCRKEWNVAYAMDKREGADYGPINKGGKRKSASKTKKHNTKKSRKSRKSRNSRKSYRKH